MCRSFSGDEIDIDILLELCEEALRAPTAGNSAGVRLTVFDGARVAQYFAVASDEEWRNRSARWPGLSRASAIILISSRPQDYLERYGEADKVDSGLSNLQSWPVPYWHTDAAMAAMGLLLLIEEQGWACTIWGNFRRDEEVRHFANLDDENLFGTVLVGRADGLDYRSASLDREIISRSQRVRRLS